VPVLDNSPVQVFKKLGLINVPDPLVVDASGILLADDMLAAAVPAQDLIKRGACPR
jgi:hypothetical protein